MGKTPFKDIKILEDYPAENYLSVISYMMMLFHEQGNYQDRNKARLKFIVEIKGETEFKKLFIAYYNDSKKFTSEFSEKSQLDIQSNEKIVTIYAPLWNIPLS